MPEVMTEASAANQDLPDEIRQVLALQRIKKQERIDALGRIVGGKRDEAVSARKASGIERIWKEDEEYYLGIDDANRANHAFTKGMNPDAGLSSSDRKDSNAGCTAFFNITRQFVDSASARMGDILLPAGDWNFSIKPTPVPELDQIKGSKQPVVSPQGNTPLNDNGTPYTLGQFAAEETASAAEKVKKAETRIRDWLTECQYHAEVRKVIENAAKIGAGVLRGAYPTKNKTRAVLNGTLKIKEEIIPGSKSVDPRNFFPDGNCGDNIQHGNYVLERDYISARQLRAFKGMPGYLSDNIDNILKEGPSKCNTNRPEGAKDDDRFEIWYFFGNIDFDDLEALGATKKDDMPERDECPAVVVIVNDTPIKGFLNPLDNGEFPYDVMPWQRQSDSPWGVGVARQGRVSQDMLNAGGRAMMNNMGLSAAPQIILRQSAIRPADGEWTLVGGKIWLATEEADVRNVGDAFMSIVIPSMQNELGAIIQMAYKMMEDATGISFLLQGQQGSAPDTVGGMQLLHNNASALLRRIARVFDECITEPHIRRYYDWLLIHGEDDEKGDLQIDAIGSTALVEREIQSQQAAQIMQLALNPAFGYSPKKAADELLRAWRFEPSKFEMDEKEKQAASQQQPQPAPAVQAAQIRAASAEKIAAANAVHDQQTTAATLDHEEQMDKNDTDRDTAYVQSQTERDRNQAAYNMQKLQIERELALLKYANDRQVSLDSVKSELAQTSMKLSVQKELSAAALQVDAAKHDKTIAADLHKARQEVITPPTEPAGRAQPGRSFEQ